MSYNTLKALVNSKVYENTEQRITGGDMNDVLQSAIASLGAHYQMGGLVSPTDHITVGDEPVVFIATTPGTYTYFGSQVVADGEVALLVWSGTAWSKQTPDIATRTEVSQLGQEIHDTIDVELTSESTISGKYISNFGNLLDSQYYSIKLVDITSLQGQTIKIIGDCLGLTSAFKAYAFYNSTTLSSSTLVEIGEKLVNEDFNIDVLVPSRATILALVQEYSRPAMNFVSTAYSFAEKSKLDDLEERVSALENEEASSTIIEFSKSGNSIVFGSFFGTSKIGITFAPGGANGLADFRNFFTYDPSTSIDAPNIIGYLIESVGDMHAPFRFRDDGGTDSVVFTGGNHDYSGVDTAKLNYIKFYADGRLLTSDGVGSCQLLRIEWQNDVKPGNAYGDSDPYALRETHVLTFDGQRFEEWVDLGPLVNINMGLYYGFQLIPLTSQTGIQFPGALNRIKYDVSANRESGDKLCYKVIADNSSALLSMMVDNSFDIGSRSLSDATTRGAFFNSSTGKSYFTIISSSTYGVNMNAGEHYWLHGWWRVLPK